MFNTIVFIMILIRKSKILYIYRIDFNSKMHGKL